MLQGVHARERAAARSSRSTKTPPLYLAQGARHLALRVDRVDEALHLEPCVAAVLKRLFEAQAELLAARVQRQRGLHGGEAWW